MYFFIDTADQHVSAHKTMGDAARAALKKLNKTIPSGADPVKPAKAALVDRGVLLNLSGAFASIAQSEGQAAQELAQDFEQAVTALYE